MPRATVSTVPEKFDLKSCPGGWVKLRRMSYGERLHRQDIAMTMSMQADQRTKQSSMQVKQAQTAVASFEMASCVVEHNLEKDDQGTLLNFKVASDVDQLDGMIGDEIAQLIEDMHNWENQLPNSEPRSTASSSTPAPAKPAADRLTLKTDG